MTSWFDDDDELLAELAGALDDRGTDDERVDMLLTGYDLVTAEPVFPSVEAEVVHDSAVGDLAAVRDLDEGPRLVSFATDEVEIEFEVADGRVTGQVDPAVSGRLVLEQPAATPAASEVARGQLGPFDFELRHSGTFRLRLILGADDRSIVTGWVDGPHQTVQ